jgi:hypothetical protein
MEHWQARVAEYARAGDEPDNGEAVTLAEAGYRAGSGAGRALELALPESETGADEESTTPAEIETAAEIALKNGVYHEIRRKLNERFGIPPHEIAFIHDADSPAKKATLFEAVNAGRVRVLLGSTAKLGTGVNVQQRLIALHHVDQPWKPAELEQREGRILRQGNIYPEVFVFHYVTERSFDGYMLQTLEAKARFISQIMAGEVTARTAEDVGDMVLTVAQVKAIASGNPLVQRRIELEVNLVKLDRLRSAYYRNRAAMLAELESLPARIAAQAAEIAGHEYALSTRQPLADDAFSCALKRNLQSDETIVFDKRERAGAHLRHLADGLIERLRRSTGRQSLTAEVGAYRGFTVSVSASGNSRLAHASSLFNYNSEIRLQATAGGPVYVAHIGESNVGLTHSIDYQLRHLEERLAQAQAGLAQLQARQTGFQAEMAKPWGHIAEYRRVCREYEAAEASLAAAGVKVGSAVQLAVADEGPDSDGADTSDTPAETTEKVLSAPRNALTGLETCPVIVEEGLEIAAKPVEATGFVGGAAAQSLMFALSEGLPDDTNESDIFAAPPVAQDEIVSSTSETAPASLLSNGSALNSQQSRPGNLPREKDKLVNSGTVSHSGQQTSFIW